ncbi:MAG TPA: MarR family transcriptional regulator [Streptosporangiaceae bacterium]|jgi:DNA-binding transcriptional regulator GbsR (MarR family)
MAADDAAENLALVLMRNGLQKAPARVLAAFLFAEEESVTATDLGERLGMNSGSVSTAITMLRTVALIERAPAPGSRREHYRLREHAWATLMSGQNAVVQAMLDAAEDGIAATGDDSPAHRRLTEMRDFYAFVFRELPDLIDRWKAERTAGRG